MHNLFKSIDIIDCNDCEDISKGYRGEISGYLSFGDIVDKANEVITTEALKKAVEFAKERKSVIPFLFEHQSDLMIGHSEISKTAVVEDNGGLRIIAKFGLSDLAQEKYELTKSGEYKSLSIGASYRPSTIQKKYTGRGKPILLYNEIQIKEASLVKNPCNQEALIDIVKSADVALFANVMSKREWKEILREWVFKYMSNNQLDTLFNLIARNPNIDYIDDILSFSGNQIESDDLLEEMINSVKNILTNKNLMQDNSNTDAKTEKSAANTLEVSEMLKFSEMLKKIK